MARTPTLLLAAGIAFAWHLSVAAESARAVDIDVPETQIGPICAEEHRPLVQIDDLVVVNTNRTCATIFIGEGAPIDTQCDDTTCEKVRIDDEAPNVGNVLDTQPTAGPASSLFWGAGRVWTSDGDGAGSTMDADLLDGLTSTQLLRNDQSGAIAGDLGVAGELAVGAPGAGTSKVRAAGVIESTAGGFKFPDGTVQTTASSTVEYDSGWFAVGPNQIHGKAHGLGAIPTRYTVLVSQSPSGEPAHLGGWMNSNDADNCGRGTMITDITTTAYNLRTGCRGADVSVFDTYPANQGNQRVNFDNGYARVMMWK